MDWNHLDDKDVLRYMRKKFHGGRSRFAAALDYAALRAIVFFGAYLAFLPRFASRATALLLASIALSIAMLILHMAGEIRYARFCEKEYGRIRKQLLTDRLMLLDMQVAIPLVSTLCPMGTTPVVLERALPVDADALLSLVRAHTGCGELHVFSCMPYDETARAFAARTNGMLTLHPPEELIAAAIEADMRPSDTEVLEAIKAQVAFAKTQKRQKLPSPFARSNAKKYLLLALLLTGLSFVTKYALYYRMLAGLCMTISVYGTLMKRPSINQ